MKTICVILEFGRGETETICKLLSEQQKLKRTNKAEPIKILIFLRSCWIGQMWKTLVSMEAVLIFRTELTKR